METKWIAIAVIVCAIGFFSALSNKADRDAEVKIACFKVAEAMAASENPGSLKIHCE